MAGSFADVPAQRLAYDIDGTSVIRRTESSGAVSSLTLTQKQILNNENNGDSISYSTGGHMIFVFPTSTKIYGYLYDVSVDSPANITLVISYSTDTTNGIDGTWTNLPTPTSVSSASPTYRNSITTLASPVDAKALRFYVKGTWSGYEYTNYYKGIHIYGNPNTSLELDFWHPTLDQAITPAYFDFGDVSVGSSSTKIFRLKNFSTQAAKNVKVSLDVLTETSPTIISQHLLSTDNVNWYSYVDLPESGGIAIDSVTNAPNNISSLIYLKRNTLSNAQVGLYTGRIVANVGIWI